MVFQNDLESRRQYMHWKSPSSSRQKKARHSKSKFKAMMIIFSTSEGFVHVDWVPESQTVNQVCYKEVLTNLRERVRRRRRPEMWKNGSWFLHQDNAPAHNALSVKTFWTKHKIIVLEHPPYSPYLAPCEFFFISKDQAWVKRNQVRFRRCSEGKSNGAHEQVVRRRPAALLPTVEDSHGAVYGSGRGVH